MAWYGCILPLPVNEKLNPGRLSTTRKKYTPAFKAECVRQVAAGARQTDVARAQGISPGRWQRPALEAAVPSRAEIKRLRAGISAGT
ncbi:MAG: transposase [Hymenobacter sp.]|nr:transposase [Hymenobacter sp.]